MSHYFYKSPKYKALQSRKMKENWRKGKFDFLHKREQRRCYRKKCTVIFTVTKSNPKQYCSRSCATSINNSKRKLSSETKGKIAKALRGKPTGRKGILLVPRENIICANKKCKKKFLGEPWKKRKFCSNTCSIAIIGGRATSPKAARGKSGIRFDISKDLYFYSRWEANFVRILNYLGEQWVYQPKTFDIGSQNYTPDFYLPGKDEYVEIKNFMGKYSKQRDRKFRESYPNIKLKLILKKEYINLENKYSKLIKNWEYKNSK